MSNTVSKSDGKHIVILGAGYGGLRCTQHLLDMGAPAKGNSLELIDRHSYHTIVTELHEVAACGSEAIQLTVSLPYLFAGKPVELTKAEVTGFDFDQKLIKTTEKQDIKYDLLVIALGSEANYFHIPGLKENSYTLGSLWEAHEICKHVEDQFRQAQVETDSEKRNTLLTFVIGGGGWTGTELAGELADQLAVFCQQYGIARSDAHLIVIEMAPTILSGLNPDWIHESTRVLKAKGVELMTNSAVERVEDLGAQGKAIYIKNQTKPVTAGTLVWTGGIRANDLVANSGLPTGPGGRIKINQFQQAEGHPDIYVIGDSSLVIDPDSGKPMPSSGQLAGLQAENAARNIMAYLTHGEQEPFKPHLIGILISLGRSDAVGEVLNREITGMPALAAKKLSEARWLYEIGGPGLVISRTIGPKPKVA